MKNWFSNLKREDRNLLITFIIFAILLLIFFSYKLINDIVSKNRSKKEEIVKNYVIKDYNKDNILKIEIEYELENQKNNKKDILVIEKKEGKWAFDKLNYEISESSVDLFLDYFRSLDYLDVIENYDEELLNICGLKNYKTKIKLFDKNNNIYEVFLGNETPDKYGYYLLYNNKIYIVDSFSYAGISKRLSDFRENKIFKKLSITEIGLYFFGNYIDNIQNKFYFLNNSWVWESNYQKEYYFNLQNPGIDQLNKNLLDFEVSEFDLPYKKIKKPEYILEIKKGNGEILVRLYFEESEEEGLPEYKTYIIYDEINKKAYKANLKNIYSYFTQNPDIFSKIREEKK